MRWAWAMALAGAALAFGVAPAQAQSSAPLVEGQAAYMERCRHETIAEIPNASAQVDAICSSKWDQITIAGPLADAILAIAPAPGAAFDAPGARVRMGPLPGLYVAVNPTPAPGVTLNWSRDGEPIPFDFEGALHARGATLAMIGCEWFGYSENTRVYRVDAEGKVPFAVTVHNLNAAVASQSSSFSVTADFSAHLPTLASLSTGGSEYAATCPE